MDKLPTLDELRAANDAALLAYIKESVCEPLDKTVNEFFEANPDAGPQWVTWCGALIKIENPRALAAKEPVL